MSKHRFQGHAPRPTKGTLVAAAKQQVKMDEQKAAEPLPPVDETKFETRLPAEVVEKAAEVGVVLGDPADEEPVNGSGASGAAQEVTPPVPAVSTAAPPATTPAAKENPLYSLGKRYSAKTDRNSATWSLLTKALAEGPKTMAQLTEVVKEAGHKDFLGYMTRGGHIVPYVPKEQAAN